MNCGQFEARLNLVLDQRLSPAGDPALLAHAAVCASCDESLADHVDLMACVARSSVPRVREGFANRVVAAAGPVSAGVVVVRPRHVKRVLMALGVGLSSAAAMLLAISIVWQARRTDPSGGERVVATHGLNSADLLVGAPALWSKELAMAGSTLRFDEVDRIAPGFRPLRESLAIIWDALRRAWSPDQDAESLPPQQRTGHWQVSAVGVG